MPTHSLAIPQLPYAMPEDWQAAVAPFLATEDMERLNQNLVAEYQTGATIYPPAPCVFAALRYTPYARVRAVWLGQDPYHEEGQACGLSFAVGAGIPAPRSLCNMMQEYQDDLGIPAPRAIDLTRWAAQGVLMLNTVLTVRAHEAGSHRGLGWEAVTAAILKAVVAKPTPVAFILLGRDARSYKPLVFQWPHVVFEAAHPSPLSAHRGFFGCRLYSTVNALLASRGAPPLDWRLD